MSDVAPLTDAEIAAISGYTSGPWAMQPGYEDGTIFIIGGNLGGLVGAGLAWPTEIESGDLRRVEANARLLAAGPALLATIRDRDDRLAAAAAQIETLRAEMSRGQDALGAAREAMAWISSWVSNPVGAYSVAALDGLFQISRERADAALAKIDALTGES